MPPCLLTSRERDPRSKSSHSIHFNGKYTECDGKVIVSSVLAERVQTFLYEWCVCISISICVEKPVPVFLWDVCISENLALFLATLLCMRMSIPFGKPGLLYVEYGSNESNLIRCIPLV